MYSTARHDGIIDLLLPSFPLLSPSLILTLTPVPNCPHRSTLARELLPLRSRLPLNNPQDHLQRLRQLQDGKAAAEAEAEARAGAGVGGGK